MSPASFVRVAVQQAKVVGHAVFVVETRAETMFTHARRFGHILQIEVEPQFRRQGIGQALLADCERIAVEKGLPRILLDVWSFNLNAREFYRSCGYADHGFKMLREI